MPFDPSELRKFSQGGETISRAAGISFEQWAEGEMGLVAKAWAGAIHAQTIPQAELRARNRSLNKLGLTKGKVTINSGVRGKEGTVWIRARNGKFLPAGSVAHNAGAFTPTPKRHFSPAQWRDGQGGVWDYQSTTGVIAMAKRTIGLARQSVIQAADAIGIAIERVAGGGGLTAGEIATARAAVAGDGKSYVNGTGSRTKNGDTFSIEMVNTYPNLHEAKIDVALANAVGQRVGAAKGLEEKIAAGVSSATRSLPYLQVTR